MQCCHRTAQSVFPYHIILCSEKTYIKVTELISRCSRRHHNGATTGRRRKENEREYPGYPGTFQATGPSRPPRSGYPGALPSAGHEADNIVIHDGVLQEHRCVRDQQVSHFVCER